MRRAMIFPSVGFAGRVVPGFLYSSFEVLRIPIDFHCSPSFPDPCVIISYVLVSLSKLPCIIHSHS